MSGYGFLRQRRWLGLALLVVLAVVAFVLLSRWQLHRLDERRAANALVSAHADAPAVPVSDVMRAGAPASTVGDEQQWRPVTATGRYDAARQVLVRKRPLDSQNGYWVVTPLVTDSGAVLVVNRGWLKATTGATEVQPAPEPPTGEVTITGRVQPGQQAERPQPTDLPHGQVTDLDVGLVTGDSADAYPGYVDLETSTPAQDGGLTPIPLPELDEGPHLSYAIQWVIFAVVVVVAFVRLARRERYFGDTTQRTDVAPPAPTG